MRGIALAIICAAIVLVPLAVWWMVRTRALLRVAGVDPQFVRTVPDRVRYTSMGAIVLLTATAATASLTVALSLVFTGRHWLLFLPVGMLWGAIVLNFDRWIVSTIDYGPLTAEGAALGRKSHTWPKVVHFLVRFTMAALVGLVISEPIVLAIFGPEINQQLAAQHVADIHQQTAQINASASKQLTIIDHPVAVAQKALRSAAQKANHAHKIYLCELTAQCHKLPPGQVTQVPGMGPQTTQDYRTWQSALRQERRDQRLADRASTRARSQAAALRAQTNSRISAAAKKIDADNGLLARERALDTLSRQNPGFLLRRLLLWMALMFIDLAPVLLKTFSPGTVCDVLQRNAAVRLVRNSRLDSEADSDHESRKRAVTRDYDLKYHVARTEAEYHHGVSTLDGGRAVPGVNGVSAPAGTAGMAGAAGVVSAAGTAATANGLGSNGTGPELNATTLTGPVPQPGGHGAGGGGHQPEWALATPTSAAIPGGWVIGHRWHIQRPLADAPHSGRVPFVAVDLQREFPFEVVVKIIAPPPGAVGQEALRDRRHAQMEMSLPLGPVHDNIAEVLDCDLDVEHGFYIVTRLYPATLERHLRDAVEQERLTLGEVLDFAVQILAGLRAAWQRGLVHLDLKPANVALAQDGTVKLIDFGLAQHYQRANGGNDTTAAARFTPFYAPPEQMARQPNWISRNADIRSLGAVIYRMLTGYPPLYREARALHLIDLYGQYESHSDVMHLVCTVEPVPARELISYLPEELDMLVRQWLRADPQMRCPGAPHTMAERVWVELDAIHKQMQAVPGASYLVGPRVTSEPTNTRLRAQWSDRKPAAHPGPATEAPKPRQSLSRAEATLDEPGGDAPGSGAPGELAVQEAAVMTRYPEPEHGPGDEENAG
jgi:serine/threonine protein kinase